MNNLIPCCKPKLSKICLRNTITGKKPKCPNQLSYSFNYSSSLERNFPKIYPNIYIYIYNIYIYIYIFVLGALVWEINGVTFQRKKKKRKKKKRKKRHGCLCVYNSTPQLVGLTRYGLKISCRESINASKTNKVVNNQVN
jgi:hypothetical protein